MRRLSATDLVPEFDYFRDLGFPEEEIVGKDQRAEHRERLAAAEAAVLEAAAETPQGQ